MKSLILLLSLLPLAFSGSTLISYQGGSPVSNLGSPQLEGQNLGDKIDSNSPRGFIQPGKDREGIPALAYHRDSHVRRAEVKGKGSYGPEKNYRIEYHLSVAKAYEKLVLFQWKKEDKTEQPVQNVPFDVAFAQNNLLSIRYTTPGKKRATIWTDSKPFALGKMHNITLMFDTAAAGPNTLKAWIDDERVLDKDGLRLWTGATYPKFGIYRGELDAGDEGEDSAHVFDSWVYEVTVEQS